MDDVGSGTNRACSITVRRWRWFRRVTETWLSSGKPEYCYNEFAISHQIGAAHDRWYREPDGKEAGCGLAIALANLWDQQMRIQRLGTLQRG